MTIPSELTMIKGNSLLEYMITNKR